MIPIFNEYSIQLMGLCFWMFMAAFMMNWFLADLFDVISLTSSLALP